uniref:Anaphase-promoting complex subunit 4 WD40 domain-containing protein n=1 Tax=Compsopogon caeruleus TaxID=31354 RepID=A0A6T6D0J0_9RHOD
MAVPNPGLDRVRLTDEIVESLKRGRVFSRAGPGLDTTTENLTGQVNSLGFSDDGTRLIASADNDRLAVYDVLGGKVHEHHKTGGCRAATYVPPNSNAALYISKGGQCIVHLDIATSTQNNFYVGADTSAVASGQVSAKTTFWKNLFEYPRERDEDAFTSLTVHGTGRYFLTVGRGLTKLVRLWETHGKRRSFAHLKIQTESFPTATFDPSGLVFAVAYQERPHGQCIKFFDMRKYSDGPFLCGYFASDRNPAWLSFSSNGKYVMWTTAEELTENEHATVLRVCDARTLWETRKVVAYAQGETWAKESIQPEAGFTRDSNYFFCGHADTNIRFWPVEPSAQKSTQVKDADTTIGGVLESPVATLAGHALASNCVKWNPVYPILASACQNIILWRPDHPSCFSVPPEAPQPP